VDMHLHLADGTVHSRPMTGGSQKLQSDLATAR